MTFVTPGRFEEEACAAKAVKLRGSQKVLLRLLWLSKRPGAVVGDFDDKQISGLIVGSVWLMEEPGDIRAGSRMNTRMSLL